MMETPTITKSAYATTEYHVADSGIGNLHLARVNFGPMGGCVFPQHQDEYQEVTEQAVQRLGINQVTTRVVRVFILDPNENLKLESRMIYRGDERLTDLTDQELFFELPMGDLLKRHNELRSKTVDKVQTARLSKEVFLEPVRIRELKMVVVDVAKF